MTQEGEPYRRHPSEPVYPIPLPPELADFLRRQGDYACLMQATDLGTAHVLKAPAADIIRARGTVPIRVQHALYDHRAAPVIRTVLSVYDVPAHPLRLECFANVADASQRADFATLADQETLMLLFYDEQLHHRLSKVVPIQQREDILRTLAAADALAARIPPWRYHFERAKADIVRTTSL